MNMFIIVAFALFATAATAACPGTIWLTADGCGEEGQQGFIFGDIVYVNGANFSARDYNWSVMGMKGEPACDPLETVARGSISTNGSFCFEAYTVQQDDCGEYAAHVSGKTRHYHVMEGVPEFGVLAGLIALTGGLLIVMRRR